MFLLTKDTYIQWIIFIFSFGFNKWRDPLRPTQVLAKIAKEEGLDGPNYSTGRVRIDNKTFVAPSQILEESGKIMYYYVEGDPFY